LYSIALLVRTHCAIRFSSLGVDVGVAVAVGAFPGCFYSTRAFSTIP